MLVCRGWRQAVASLPQLWRDLEWQQPVLQRDPASQRRLCAFLRCLAGLCRLGGVQQLKIDAIYFWEEEDDIKAWKISDIIPALPEGPWASLEAAAGAAAPTLTSLQLRIPGIPLHCSWLAGLQRLQQLELVLASAPLTALLQAAAALPHLTPVSLTSACESTAAVPSVWG